MVKSSSIVLVIMLLLASTMYAYQSYRIPNFIDNDYDCEKHPGFVSESNPFIFESQQNYIDRKGKAIQKQIEEVCN